MSSDYKIDAVIIWVDGNDPEWQRQRAKYLPEQRTDYRPERYRDMGILKYWFRGIDVYAPWLNTIHFVTNGQVPTWLNCNAPRLHLVFHRDYMPSEYLPTFSANPIELNLHRIDGLSERFIYFNDDELIIAPVTPEDFFDGGLPRQAASFLPAFFDSTDTVFSEILRNDFDFICRHFSRVSFLPFLRKYLSTQNGGMRTGLRNAKNIFLGIPGIEYSHLAMPFCKSTFSEVWNAEEETLDLTCKHKFRSADDVNQFIFQYWQIATGKFSPVPEKSRGRYFYLPTSYPDAVKCIRQQQAKTICLNDGHFLTDGDYCRCKDEITAALDTLLPLKSSFEL